MQFNFPNSASPRRGLADSGTSFLLPLEFERAFGGFDFNFDVGRWRRPASQPDSFVAGIVIGHEVRKGFELMAELHAESSTNFARQESIVNFGARWDLSPRYTLLVSAGCDLRNEFGPENTFITYLGIQTHL